MKKNRSVVNVCRNVHELEEPLNEFNRIVSALDLEKLGSSQIPKLNEFRVLIDNVQISVSKVVAGHVISNQDTFIDLARVPRDLTCILIMPEGINLPLVHTFSNNSEFWAELNKACNVLSDMVEGVLVFASIYADSFLIESNESLVNKVDELVLQVAKNSRSTSELELINEAIKEANSTVNKSERSVHKAIEDIDHEVSSSKQSLSDFRISLESDMRGEAEQLKMDAKESIYRELANTKKQLEEVVELSEHYKEKFESLYDEMKTMYGIAGDGKLADYNNKQAEVERKAADELRTKGIYWLGLPILVTGLFIVHFMLSSSELTFEWILTRFLSISISASIAVYLLKESANHRSKENIYRQRGTQLATIGSYLKDFTDEKEKMRVKSELVSTFYSFHNGKADTSNVPDPNAQIKEVVALSKSLSKIVPTYRTTALQPDKESYYSSKRGSDSDYSGQHTSTNGNSTTGNTANSRTVHSHNNMKY
ncbi:hypothetical protein OPW36_15935 [Vibrio europaeus]|uniref:Uncharacterized protein n=1 Tax=Vibrio europaeus TaxID=300876 RepID=A0AAE7AX96_9VIBR|nr:hypothetical protein [Vibrio europaeus]MDC5805716.1 hypothetical protein [Vibrio europaeus]MDC5812013.1 hypothetical protein [Vibrio europaeus]MDC5826210.1 hypothetical protein [Vibrio europaeus]MDC5831575.1 hypothetical protein [Vibrio europaeus]MDC5834530.1 hypothetical protein [Vibrio europaeus]